MAYETRIASSPTASFRNWSTQPERKPLLRLLADTPRQVPRTTAAQPSAAVLPSSAYRVEPGLNVELAVKKRHEHYSRGGAFDEATVYGARDGYEQLMDRYLAPTYERAVALLTTRDWSKEAPGELRRMGSAVEYLTTHAGIELEQRERLAGHWENAVQAMGYLAGVPCPIPLVETTLHAGEGAVG